MAKKGGRIRAIGFPFLGGVLGALALPPFNLFLLCFVSLVPLLLGLDGASGRAAFARGYLYGLGFGSVNIFWLAQFVTKWTHSPWLGSVPWLIVVALFALYFGLFAYASQKLIAVKAYWAIPLVWAGVEAFRSMIPYLYFPWALSASALVPLPPLLQPAWWFGPYILSAWICWINVIAAMMMKAEAAKTTRRYVLVGVGVAVASILSFLAPPSGPTANVIAAQPGVDLAYLPKDEQMRRLSESVPDLLRVGEASHRDLIVLPEGIGTAYGEKAPVLPFEVSGSTPVLVGAQRHAEVGSYQSLYAWDGKTWQYADKVRLVIFGEYVPFRDSLGFVDSFNIPSGDLIAATEPKTLTIGKLRVGGLVCFEALFEEVARHHAADGANLLAVISMDDWYHGTGAIGNLEAAAVLRAVENRLPLVRSSPLGRTVVIDALGRIVAQTEPDQPAIARADVVLGQPSRVLPLIHEIARWVALLALVASILFRFKSRNADSP